MREQSPMPERSERDMGYAGYAGYAQPKLYGRMRALPWHCAGCRGRASMQRTDLVHPRRQQLDDGEVFAGALHVLPGRPIVKGPLHLHMLPAMTPCDMRSLNLTGVRSRTA